MQTAAKSCLCLTIFSDICVLQNTTADKPMRTQNLAVKLHLQMMAWPPGPDAGLPFYSKRSPIHTVHQPHSPISRHIFTTNSQAVSSLQSTMKYENSAATATLS